MKLAKHSGLLNLHKYRVDQVEASIWHMFCLRYASFFLITVIGSQVAGCAGAPSVWIDQSGQSRNAIELHQAITACQSNTNSFQQQISPMLTEPCTELPYQDQLTCGAIAIATIVHETKAHMNECMASSGWRLGHPSAPRAKTPQVAFATASSNVSPQASEVPEHQNAYRTPQVLLPVIPASTGLQDVVTPEGHFTNWKLVFTGQNVIGYIDPVSVKSEGGTTHVFAMLSFSTPQRIPGTFPARSFLSEKLEVDINCGNNEYSELHEADFTGVNLAGDEVGGDRISLNKDEKILPGDFIDYVRRSVCVSS